MTTTAAPESAARWACRDVGLPDQPLIHLHEHATSVFVLPQESVVVRVSPVTSCERLKTAVDLTRWLAEQKFSATEPLDVPQPVVYGSYCITFWKHYPQPDVQAPSAKHLGSLLRALHELPRPPIQLPRNRPLVSFKAMLDVSSWLTPQHRDWLRAQAGELLDAYQQLDFPLGEGHLHGDAYPGNTLWDGEGVRLGDWDEAACGPREVDLANTFQGARFGRSTAELDAFSTEYGTDIREWDGLHVLCRIRDLHTLSSYMRRADRGDEAAQSELSYRIETLMSGDSSAQWSIV
ncbi:phosphotransferase family protein [Streptomyces sp. NPDC006704]|uniref:phosphotransferase family protein n=1 Tax=Streptomyces sp. NPDC006704 TaxID=3364760 RepID=UPI00367FE4FB